ncbi:unnamed protein product [[Actinomadura] parvosata subsp. kistnae]|uniref:Uncharacterized protein n=1 Tax=[Actinomadura] parvosata subsp. kistnae TaxID=1909395 RepID=A0A1V0ABS4_9ACTN|nr:hypothetical protein [Nonomuraea sp. ATCC 55076]AQZ67646.1 hypothetical protein BKM31_44815 [Nonomuraea sp. ATCC 55076]SPL94067.1 unnamed protein product [Actinomadura parvosata subsp. kistnae]
MTRPEDHDIEQAKREAEQSKLQAQQEFRDAKERAARHRSWAQTLRELREANGFSRLLDDAFGGGSA